MRREKESPKKPGHRRRLGALGERVAAEHLKKLGFSIRETNFRCAEGEIDIVAEKDGELVFVEVRTRSSREFGAPEETITAAKKRRLIALAEAYLQSHADLPQRCRIDLMAVEVGRGGKVGRLELIENAVAAG